MIMPKGISDWFTKGRPLRCRWQVNLDAGLQVILLTDVENSLKFELVNKGIVMNYRNVIVKMFSFC
jgi:hypothetical protein